MNESVAASESRTVTAHGIFNKNYFTPDFVKPEEYQLTETTPEEERVWKEQLENAFTNDHWLRIN